MKVVPLKTYCRISGESVSAVVSRIDRGIWFEGVHFYKLANVKERWVDIEAIEKWARSGGGYCKPK